MSTADNEDSNQLSTHELHRVFLEKATNLRNELALFQIHIKQAKLDVSISKFCKEVENEIKAVHALDLNFSPDRNDEEDAILESAVHRLRSSNLSFYEAVWNTAKRSQSVVGLQKRIKRMQQPVTAYAYAGQSSMGRCTSSKKPTRRVNVVVDVVANEGQKWIKVWTKSQKWMLLELAKEGTVLDESTSDDEDSRDSRDSSVWNTEGDGLKLVMIAKDLCNAARQVRVRHKHPEVEFVMPNMYEGVNAEVDLITEQLRATGATVDCGNTTHADNDQSREYDKQAKYNYAGMLPDSYSQNDMLTSTINVDCTLLVALVSDISHTLASTIQIPKHYQGSTYQTIFRQVQSEQADPILESALYPLLKGRKIVCTESVAAHLGKILEPMGTADEHARAQIIMAHGAYEGFSSEMLRDALQQHSAHAVPSTLQLPIEVVKFDHSSFFSKARTDTFIPRVDAVIAQKLIQSPRLTFLNASAFLHGWAKGFATLTLNRVVASWIERTIDNVLNELEDGGLSENLDLQSFTGPVIWPCKRDRSLLGCEKVIQVDSHHV